MTRDGEENRFGFLVLDDEQAERMQAGDMSAVWEFIEQNRLFLTRWARKFIRVRLAYMPQGYYEVDELLNQIYVDFPYYNIENRKMLCVSIFRSFFFISGGGLSGKRKIRENKEISLDAPRGITSRSGDSENGDALSALLPSREPTPYEALERREHIQEIAPHFFSEIGKVCGKNGETFREVIEEVFFGMSFEEVQAYATTRKS